MNIAVLIKQVPDTGASLRLAAPEGGESGGPQAAGQGPPPQKIVEEGLKWVISPYDEFALEEALRLKPLLAGPQGEGKVFAASLGPARAREALLAALAMGADEAFHLLTEAPLDDPLLAASLLKEQIAKLPSVSLVLCGRLSADSNNFAVPQMLAQLLGLPFVTNVSGLSYEAGEFRLVRECGGGAAEELKARPPLLLSADKGLNQPRFPSLQGIIRAKKKPFHAAEAKAPPEGGRTRLLSLSPPPAKAPPRMIQGSPEEQARGLIRILREEEKLL